MPQMGESIAEGTITKWLKNVGDHVDRDEPLFEISTDKVDAEIPSPAAGTLTDIKFKEGDTVEVNTIVAVLDGDGAKPQPESAVSAPAKEEPAAPAETKATTPEAVKAEPPAVERAQPVITTEERVAPKATPAATAHKTEVKPLVKKTEAAREPKQPPQPAPRDNGGAAAAEELRRTK